MNLVRTQVKTAWLWFCTVDEFGKDAGQYCMIMVLYCIDEFGKDTGQYIFSRSLDNGETNQ